MLETIRAAYLTTIAALVAQFPGQAANVPHYQAQAGAMRLGRLKRRIRTKISDFPAGTLVAFVPEDEKRAAMRREEGFSSPMVSIFAPGISSGSTLTLVRGSYVEPVCATCEGSGKLRHSAGLVTFPCHAC